MESDERGVELCHPNCRYCTGVETERARVVKWLRDTGRYAAIDVVERRGLYKLIADDIENSEHMKLSGTRS